MFKTWNPSNNCNTADWLLSAGYFLTDSFNNQLTETQRIGYFRPSFDVSYQTVQGLHFTRQEHLQRVGPALDEANDSYCQLLQPIREFFLQQEADDVKNEVIFRMNNLAPNRSLTRDEELLVKSVTDHLHYILLWMNPPVSILTDPTNSELRERMNQDENLMNDFRSRLDELRGLLGRYGIRFNRQTNRVEGTASGNQSTTIETSPQSAATPQTQQSNEPQPIQQAPEAILAPTRPNQSQNQLCFAEPLPMPDDLYEKVQGLTPLCKEAYWQFRQVQQVIGKGAGVTKCYEHIVEICKKEGKEFGISLKTWTKRVDRAKEQMGLSKLRGPKMERLTDAHQDGLSGNIEGIDEIEEEVS